jgi:hypothetical protein
MLRPESFGGNEQAMLKAAGAFWRDFRTETADVVIEAGGDLDRITVLQTQLAKWVAPEARTKTAFVFG